MAQTSLSGDRHQCQYEMTGVDLYKELGILTTIKELGILTTILTNSVYN